jgi:hypothetical protein
MKAHRTTSYALYTHIRVPVSLNWTFLILESDEELVELGNRIDTVVNRRGFATFATTALILLANAERPQITVGLRA